MAFKDDDFDFGFDPGDYQEFDWDFRLGKFQTQKLDPGQLVTDLLKSSDLSNFDSGLLASLSAGAELSNYSTGLLEELAQAARPENYDRPIRWSYQGDEERAKEHVALARHALARHALAHDNGTHMGYGRRMHTYPSTVQVTDVDSDGEAIRSYEETVEGAVQVETVFTPQERSCNVWVSPPFVRRKLRGGGDKECRGEDYIWIGMRMTGAQNSKACLNVWEPWPEGDGLNFMGSDPDTGALMSYADYSEHKDTRVSSSPEINYSGWSYWFGWVRCLSRKGGPEYFQGGLDPETRQNIWWNYQFDTQTCEDLDDIWGYGSRPSIMWHGDSPTVNWNGGTVYMSRFGAYFCGPGRAHDPEDDDQLYFESYHCDPEDPVKTFDFMHKYPDGFMGWGYGDNNVGPPLYSEYPPISWQCRGEVLPGRYIVKLGIQRERCPDSPPGGLQVEINVKLGRRPASDGEMLPKCLQFSGTFDVLTPEGRPEPVNWQPFGYNPFQADGWRDLSYYEDFYYPVTPGYGPAIHSAEGWWQGYLSVDAQNRVVEAHASTPPLILSEIGFGNNNNPSDLEDCCGNAIPDPVAPGNVKNFPPADATPAHPSTWHVYYNWMYATVISTSDEGEICLIQITSQSSYGCSCEPYGYGHKFQGYGYDDGQEVDMSGPPGFPLVLPNGTSFSPGDPVIIVGTSREYKMQVRHPGDSWFTTHADEWQHEEYRAGCICPVGACHADLLELRGITTPEC